MLVDLREDASGIPRILRSIGVKVERRLLDEGDYIVSTDCAVERKEARDFIRSLYTGRLFDQASRLSAAYKTPILIIEGELSKAIRELSRSRAVWGAVTTLCLGYGLHLFYTKDKWETADLLYVLSRRKHSSGFRGLYIKRKFKKDLSSRSQIQILSMLPGIGPKLALRILRNFGSLRRVFTASTADLSLVEGVGRVKARKIIELLDLEFEAGEDESKQQQLVDDR